MIDDVTAQKLLLSIARLENEKKRPVYIIEVVRETMERPVDAEQKPATRVDMLNLFKDDLILCDKECNLYSLDKSRQRGAYMNTESPFELCSDRLQRLFPDYRLTTNCQFMPEPTAEKINFNTIKNLLLSRDMLEYITLHELTENDKCRFLDQTFNMLQGESVAFQSFPRSGNTFLRKYLE